ncbi:DUF3011 domain-containing protein [Nostoc sp. LEGE 12447]|uniref:DUF3011 domain-containing protein n=1 Tax=Nostoc sp. LEGE 12447 TaxID=1828640 RepID=UPI003A0FF2AC
MIMRLPIISITFLVASLTTGTVLSVAAPASAQEIITCSSQNNRRNTCAINTRGRVRLIRQLSNASCRGNWGYGRNRIWVKNGCRAEFSVGGRRNGRYGRNDRYDRNDRYNRNDRYDRNDRYNR